MLPRLAYARGSSVGSSTGLAIARAARRSSIPAAMLPRNTRSTPRVFIARDSMPASPTARAVSMARSANGMDWADLSGQHQVRGKARQHPRLLGRRRRAVEQIHGFLEPLDRRRGIARQPRREAELLAGARPSLRVGGCVGRGVDQLDRLAGEADRPCGVADDDRRRRGGVEDVGEVAVGRSVRRGHDVPQLRRALVLARGLGVGVHRLGRVGGTQRGVQRQGRFLGRRPVMRQLDQSVGLRRAGTGRPCLDRAGVGAVEHPPLGRQELVVGRFLHERVTEGIALGRTRAGARDEQQLRVERLVQGAGSGRSRTGRIPRPARRIRPRGRRRRRSRRGGRRPPSCRRGGRAGGRAACRAARS